MSSNEKPHANSKNSTSDTNSKLPIGWVSASVQDLCQLNPKHPKETPDRLNVSFVPMAAVSDKTGTITDASVRPFGSVRKGFTHFADGDVLFAKITPCMENGKAASVRGLVNGLGCGTTEFYVFRQLGALDQDYLFNYIRQASYRKLARAQMQSGVGQARVPKDFVLETNLPVPPLAEQTRIVSKIESLQARTSKTRTLLAEVKPLIAQLRQSVLRSAFNGSLTADWRAQQHEAHANGSSQGDSARHETANELLKRIRVERRERWEATQLAAFEAKGKEPSKGWRDKYKEPEPVDESGLPELPEGWCWATIDQLTYDGPQNGLYVPKTQYGSGTPILRIDDYQNNWYRPNSELQCVNIDEETARTYGLKRSNLVVNRVNSPSHLGKSIVLNEEHLPAVFESNMMRLELSSDREARYVHTFLTSDLGKSLLTGNAKWAVNQASINQSDVCRTPIPLAPPREQETLLKQAESAIVALTQVKNQLNSMIATITQLDQSILSKAFRGELVPQDPNDEPASKLLARISDSRSSNAVKKKLSKKKIPRKNKS